MRYPAYHYGYVLHLSGCCEGTMTRKDDKFYCDKCSKVTAVKDWVEVKIHD